MSVLVLLGFLLLAFFALAWIAAGVIGIVNFRKTWGKILLVLAVLGGIIAVIIVAAVIMFATHRISETAVVQPYDVSTYAGITGTISIPLAGQATLMLVDDQKQRMTFTTTNGLFAVPCNRYQLYYYYTTITDNQNDEWSITCQLYKEKEFISITTNCLEQLNLGPPFTASVTVKSRRQNRIELEYLLQDDQDRFYTVRRVGRTAKPPGFQIVAPDGGELFSGTFKYG